MNRKTLFVSFLVLGFAAVATPGAIINVPGDFATIQGAIDAAGVKGDEIVVSPGTYNEVINFLGKAINLHSLSGNPMDTIIDGTGLNESVVLCISGEGAGTILEGFTITGGVALNGGGMRNTNSSPTVTDCTFTGNIANNFGGGMINDSGANPLVTNCQFINNAGNNFGGGGMRNTNSNPTVIDCIFFGNTASLYGGGIYNKVSHPTIINCVFNQNHANNFGGGLINDTGSNSTVINCTFSGNTALRGAGLYNDNPSSPIITNCTFSGNSATGSGGGIYNAHSSTPIITNCILWDDSPDGISFSAGSTPTISFSNIEGGLPAGTIDNGGNISADPLFMDADGLDNIPGTDDDNFHLSAGSLCVDAGNNTATGLTDILTDQDGLPRFSDDSNVPDTGNGATPIVDMGVFERGDCNGNGVLDNLDISSGNSQDIDSNGIPDECECLADIAPVNPDLSIGNGVVNIGDLVTVLNSFGFTTPPGEPTWLGDVNYNGVVNIDDLVDVLNGFGGCP